MRDRLALHGRCQHFFETSSFIAARSSICSARSLLSFALSILERLQPLGLRDRHAAELGLRVIERAFRYAVLAAQVSALLAVNLYVDRARQGCR
jgi:hypothetical protein